MTVISYHPASMNAHVGKAFTSGFRVYEGTDLSRIANCLLRCAWSPIVFKDGYRKSDNFIKCHYLALDFEDPEYNLASAQNDFCDVTHIIGTTRNHQVLKDGRLMDRFRVLIPWERAIVDRQEYVYNMKLITSIYPADEKCVDPARHFFPCKEIVEVIDTGEGYTVRAVPEGYLAAGSEKPDWRERQVEMAKLGILPPFVARWDKNVMPEGERTMICFYLGMDLCRIGIEIEKAYRWVLQSPTYRNTNDLLTIRNVRKAIASGYRAEGQKHGR